MLCDRTAGTAVAREAAVAWYLHSLVFLLIGTSRLTGRDSSVSGWLCERGANSRTLRRTSHRWRAEFRHWPRPALSTSVFRTARKYLPLSRVWRTSASEV